MADSHGAEKPPETGMCEKMKYLIVVEETTTGYSAYSPDLPGCISTGKTKEETVENMKEAVTFHIEGLQLAGCSIPKPSSTSAYVDIAA